MSGLVGQNIKPRDKSSPRFSHFSHFKVDPVQHSRPDDLGPSSPVGQDGDNSGREQMMRFSGGAEVEPLRLVTQGEIKGGTTICW